MNLEIAVGVEEIEHRRHKAGQHGLVVQLSRKGRQIIHRCILLIIGNLRILLCHHQYPEHLAFGVPVHQLLDMRQQIRHRRLTHGMRHVIKRVVERFRQQPVKYKGM